MCSLNSTTVLLCILIAENVDTELYADFVLIPGFTAPKRAHDDEPTVCLWSCYMFSTLYVHQLPHEGHMAPQHELQSTGKGNKATVLHHSNRFTEELLYRSSQSELLEMQTASWQLARILLHVMQSSPAPWWRDILLQNYGLVRLIFFFYLTWFTLHLTHANFIYQSVCEQKNPCHHVLPLFSDYTFTLDTQKLQKRYLQLQRSLHPDNFSQKSVVGTGM